MTFSRIAGTGSYLPGLPVDNETLIAKYEIQSSDEWITERTGIKSRHLAASGVSSSDLAEIASRNALIAANKSPEDVDLIIVATSTPDLVFPSTAALLENKLGIRNGAAAFDVQAVCSGFIFALSIADKFIRSGSHKCALVVGAEVFSRLLDWHDRGTCVLFGDGAGAILLEASDTPGVLATALHSDGAYSGMLNVPGQVCNGSVIGDPYLRMDGQAVFKFAVKVLAEVANEAIAAASLTRHDIDWLVPHQANIRIIQATARKLGIPIEKCVLTVSEHGNTSAASVPLALDHGIRQGLIQRGQRVLVEGVGGGFTWGAAVIGY